ncbi:hypothetical protein A3Q56_02988 [Intoshia linei]|uniref:ELYS-like domain-containing protein n=1 Tax=Intoshia linei TaxID=1819745 RepID=A0A177B766_9BILA|nr:hypothetical protein A3Q56_02988 [Intoshia linei]
MISIKSKIESVVDCNHLCSSVSLKQKSLFNFGFECESTCNDICGFFKYLPFCWLISDSLILEVYNMENVCVSRVNLKSFFLKQNDDSIRILNCIDATPDMKEADVYNPQEIKKYLCISAYSHKKNCSYVVFYLVNAWQIAHAVQFDDEVETIHCFYDTFDFLNPSTIRDTSANLVVGFKDGKLVLVNLLVPKNCVMFGIQCDIKPVHLIPSTVKLDWIKSVREKYVGYTIGIFLNDFYYRKRGLVFSSKFADYVDVSENYTYPTCIYYCKYTKSLFVGHYNGVLHVISFKCWPKEASHKFYNTPNNHPITNLCIQKPDNDPRYHLYLWVVYLSNRLPNKAMMCLYQLSFQVQKFWKHKDGKTIDDTLDAESDTETDKLKPESFTEDCEKSFVVIGDKNTYIKLLKMTLILNMNLYDVLNFKKQSIQLTINNIIRFYNDGALCETFFGIQIVNSMQVFMLLFDLDLWYECRVTCGPRKPFFGLYQLDDVKSNKLDINCLQYVSDSFRTCPIFKKIGRLPIYTKSSFSFYQFTSSRVITRHNFGSYFDKLIDSNDDNIYQTFTTIWNYVNMAMWGVKKFSNSEINDICFEAFFDKKYLMKLVKFYNMVKTNPNKNINNLSLVFLQWLWSIAIDQKNIIKSLISKLLLNFFEVNPTNLRISLIKLKDIKKIYTHIINSANQDHSTQISENIEAVSILIEYGNVCLWLLNEGIFKHVYLTKPRNPTARIVNKFSGINPLINIVLESIGFSNFSQIWSSEPCKYPPNSIDNILKMFLLKFVKSQEKCAILLYYLCDIDGINNTLQKLNHFKKCFDISTDTCNVIIASWYCDNLNFKEASLWIVKITYENNPLFVHFLNKFVSAKKFNDAYYFCMQLKYEKLENISLQSLTNILIVFLNKKKCIDNVDNFMSNVKYYKYDLNQIVENFCLENELPHPNLSNCENVSTPVVESVKIKVPKIINCNITYTNEILSSMLDEQVDQISSITPTSIILPPGCLKRPKDRNDIVVSKKIRFDIDENEIACRSFIKKPQLSRRKAYRMVVSNFRKNRNKLILMKRKNLIKEKELEQIQENDADTKVSEQSTTLNTKVSTSTHSLLERKHNFMWRYIKNDKQVLKYQDSFDESMREQLKKPNMSINLDDIDEESCAAEFVFSEPSEIDISHISNSASNQTNQINFDFEKYNVNARLNQSSNVKITSVPLLLCNNQSKHTFYENTSKFRKIYRQILKNPELCSKVPNKIYFQSIITDPKSSILKNVKSDTIYKLDCQNMKNVQEDTITTNVNEVNIENNFKKDENTHEHVSLNSFIASNESIETNFLTEKETKNMDFKLIQSKDNKSIHMGDFKNEKKEVESYIPSFLEVEGKNVIDESNGPFDENRKLKNSNSLLDKKSTSEGKSDENKKLKNSNSPLEEKLTSEGISDENCNFTLLCEKKSDDIKFEKIINIPYKPEKCIYEPYEQSESENDTSKFFHRKISFEINESVKHVESVQPVKPIEFNIEKIEKRNYCCEGKLDVKLDPLNFEPIPVPNNDNSIHEVNESLIDKMSKNVEKAKLNISNLQKNVQNENLLLLNRVDSVKDDIETKLKEIQADIENDVDFNNVYNLESVFDEKKNVKKLVKTKEECRVSPMNKVVKRVSIQRSNAMRLKRDDNQFVQSPEQISIASNFRILRSHTRDGRENQCSTPKSKNHNPTNVPVKKSNEIIKEPIPPTTTQTMNNIKPVVEKDNNSIVGVKIKKTKKNYQAVKKLKFTPPRTRSFTRRHSIILPNTYESNEINLKKVNIIKTKKDEKKTKKTNEKRNLSSRKM